MLTLTLVTYCGRIERHLVVGVRRGGIAASVALCAGDSAGVRCACTIATAAAATAGRRSGRRAALAGADYAAHDGGYDRDDKQGHAELDPLAKAFLGCGLRRDVAC